MQRTIRSDAHGPYLTVNGETFRPAYAVQAQAQTLIGQRLDVQASASRPFGRIAGLWKPGERWSIAWWPVDRVNPH